MELKIKQLSILRMPTCMWLCRGRPNGNHYVLTCVCADVISEPKALGTSISKNSESESHVLLKLALIC